MALPPPSLARTSDPRSGGMRFAPKPPPSPNVNPLIRQLGLQEVLDRDSADIPSPEIDLTGNAQVESALAGHVRLAWQRNKLAKEKIDQKMLADLRARRGVY